MRRSTSGWPPATCVSPWAASRRSCRSTTSCRSSGRPRRTASTSASGPASSPTGSKRSSPPAGSSTADRGSGTRGSRCRAGRSRSTGAPTGLPMWNDPALFADPWAEIEDDAFAPGSADPGAAASVRRGRHGRVRPSPGPGQGGFRGPGGPAVPGPASARWRPAGGRPGRDGRLHPGAGCAGPAARRDRAGADGLGASAAPGDRRSRAGGRRPRTLTPRTTRVPACRTAPTGPARTGGCGADASCWCPATRRRGCGCRSTPSPGRRRSPRRSPTRSPSATFPPVPASWAIDPAARSRGAGRRSPADGAGGRGARRHLYVFLPPLEDLDGFVELIAIVERAPPRWATPVVLEGYGPPADPRLQSLSVTPDPGVIEVNVQPTGSWRRPVCARSVLYEEARQTRLGTETFDVDGPTPGRVGATTSPWAAPLRPTRRCCAGPTCCVSLLTYWQRHPSLSYLFSGRFIGPTSQAPRVDEGRAETLYELEIAFAEIARLTAADGAVSPVGGGPCAAAPAHRHHREHPPRRVLHRQALQPGLRARPARTAGTARLRDAAARPDGAGPGAAGALAGRPVLGRAAAGTADPARRRTCTDVTSSALRHRRHRGGGRRSARSTGSTSRPAGSTRSPSSGSRGSAR